MAVSKKREDPQPARKKPVRSKSVMKREAAQEAPLSTQVTGVRNWGNSEKPAFLKSRSARVREEGIKNMMSSWALFNVTPIIFFEEDELQDLIDLEMAGRRSFAFVKRLHNALTRKRINRERAAYREACGVDQKNVSKKFTKK